VLKPRSSTKRYRPALRFRQIVAACEAEAGGDVTDLERDIINQAAALTYRGEELQAAMLRGDPVDNDELVRLSSTAKRLLGTIRTKAEARSPPVLISCVSTSPARQRRPLELLTRHGCPAPPRSPSQTPCATRFCSRAGSRSRRPGIF
jgi:hypothetical protein